MEVFDATDILKKRPSRKKAIPNSENNKKCRMCLKVPKNLLPITNSIKNKFMELTKLELPSSDALPNLICYKCEKEIDDTYRLRERLISIQKMQHEEVGEAPVIFDSNFSSLNLKQEEDNDVFAESLEILSGSDYPSDIKNEVVEFKNEEAQIDPEAFKNFKRIRNKNKKWIYVCGFCGKHVTTPFSLRLHIKTFHLGLENNFRCTYEGCTNAYNTESRLKTHLRQHKIDKEEARLIRQEKKRLYTCDYCGKQVTTPFSLRLHIKTFHMGLEKNFKCTYEGCMNAYNTESRLKTHLRQHKIDKEEARLARQAKKRLMTCDYCGRTVTTKFSLRLHMKTFHMGLEKNFRCTYEGCTNAYNTESRLKTHLRQHKIDKEEAKRIRDAKKTLHTCDYCGKQVTTPFSLRLHIKTFHLGLERNFACTFEGCNYAYNTENRLKAHLLSHKEDKSVLCPYCGEKKHNRPALKKHIDTVHFNKPLDALNGSLICPYCGKQVTTKRGLQLHIDGVHHKINKYFCDLCDFKAPEKGRIRNHVVTHIKMENRRVFCPICGLSSSCNLYMKRHIKEHTSGIEFPCHCGKVFKSKESIRMHIRTVHKKIKNHVCELCGRAFFNKVDLNNHNYLIHNADKVVKNIPCPICGKLFAVQNRLNLHMIYHRIKYTCDYAGCGETFTTQKRLDRHIEQHELKVLMNVQNV